MLELHIFNKESAEQNGLSDWSSSGSSIRTFTLSLQSDKLREKDNNEDLELWKQISFEMRENDFVRKLMTAYNGETIQVELIEGFHHVFLYDTEANVLRIDACSRAKPYNEKLIPLYLFAIYYAFARKTLTADQIFASSFKFLKSFAEEQLRGITSMLEEDQVGRRKVDAGDHLYDFLNIVLLDKQNNSLDTKEQLISVQLLRNRSIAGRLPVDINRFENIINYYEESGQDSFSGDATQELFDAFKDSFEAKYAKLYYKHLLEALRKIGLGIVAQRGSRVAHEQGPILVNAGNVQLPEDTQVELKKSFVAIKTEVTKLLELNDKYKLKASVELEKEQVELSNFLDEFHFLIDQKENAKARFVKNCKLMNKSFGATIQELEVLAQEKLDATNFLTCFDALKVIAKDFYAQSLSIEQRVKKTPHTRKKAVIFVQRPSSRSGHFIPRILLGKNLYVETDNESEVNRIDAIPFNFVVPDFKYISNNVDSFFENASISIVTDQKTGEPDIKWENAEDLAIALAPHIYDAIKSTADRCQSEKAQMQGTRNEDEGSLLVANDLTRNERNTAGGAFKADRKFHYQLETTLIGPLIDLFVALLEHEMSGLASIAEAGEIAEEAVAERIERYRDEVMEQARFVFKYYLLEDYVLEHALKEGLTDVEASFEVIMSMRDVQADIAKFCLLARKQPDLVRSIKDQYDISVGFLSPKKAAEQVSAKINEHVSSAEARIFIKKYIRYPESTARKEHLAANKHIKAIQIGSRKDLPGLDYSYHLTVAPSRIDFGQHVVASVTSLMGRMLGANDPEALQLGKEYIDLVSETQNSLFESAADAGSAKVCENTCRAIQYSKAISFQAVFQNLNMDGKATRATINTRNTTAAGQHLMEHGTMASTGYCITKEPLFILLALSIDSEDILVKLGVENAKTRTELQDFFKNLLATREQFLSELDWQAYAYEEISSSSLVKQFLSDEYYEWLPSPAAMSTLIKHMSDHPSVDFRLQKDYARLSTELIKQARVINESGIIQRVQIMNDAIRRANILNADDTGAKNYEDLCIALNASYKGNVSDERENANQYIMALLLHNRSLLKNTSNPAVKELFDEQIARHKLPKELRFFDPLVDPDVFMGGQMQEIAETTVQKIIAASQSLVEPLTEEIITAAVKTYGNDILSWRIINKRLAQVDADVREAFKASMQGLAAELRYLESYAKGFYKNPYIAYQGVDVIQLNSDHDDLKVIADNLVDLRTTMQTGNESSLLVLVDDPQQAKKPFVDYEKAREWMALGGTVSSHMISSETYEKWRKDVDEERIWAKSYINHVLLTDDEELAKSAEQKFANFQAVAELKRELLVQKFNEAKEMGVSLKILKRYQEHLRCLRKTLNYQSVSELEFDDWLILGGRWVLNGESQDNIDYVINLFDKSNKLKSVSQKGANVLELFVQERRALPLSERKRIINISGSTKEADLVVSSAADSLEFRALAAKEAKSVAIRMKAFRQYEAELGSSLDLSSIAALITEWERKVDELESCMINGKDKFNSNTANTLFGQQLRLLELTANYFINNYLEQSKDKLAAKQIVNNLINAKEIHKDLIEQVFGDHKSNKGLFADLAKATSEEDQAALAKLGEILIYTYLLSLIINKDEANEVINQLAIFFDQYLNVHEEDYPPYMFHSICAGMSFGFNQTYFMKPELREKMFKLSYQTGDRVYKLVRATIISRTILNQASQEYKDALLGDYNNGIIPIGYQHETICIEERFWDCMRALRNFIRNYHDKHPLPVVIKGADATIDKLFRYKLDANVKLTWIAGISNIGKHSWDLNCVLRSPLLRQEVCISPDMQTQYVNVSVFTPFLSPEGRIRQVYTAFHPEVISSVDKLVPYEGAEQEYLENEEGFVHALVILNDEDLPNPDITMSAHTHPQYIDGTTQKLGVPETWSYLSMRQMYAKTELSSILDSVGMKALAQLEFKEKEFISKEEVLASIEARLNAKGYGHIDIWILKASKDSGGRGITKALNLRSQDDLREMVDFIWQKSQSDDVVMQEFVPNNARAFISGSFTQDIKEAFVESGIEVEDFTPHEQIYFAMRSFQSTSGIKGYLFSCNIGNSTVNAGQGAKMFYGDPIKIMPLYIAGKIQNLLEEQGEVILKEAIPKHAINFAQKEGIETSESRGGISSTMMLNGLFDYIPYYYIVRDDKEYKLYCENNSFGGINFYYSYQGERVDLVSGKTHKDSLIAIENALKDSVNGLWQGAESEIGIDLAKIELNSGLGQANLLQKAIEEAAPENRDLFLEWTKDLGVVAMHNRINSTV